MNRNTEEKSALKQQMISMQEDFEKQIAELKLRHDEETDQLWTEL